MNSRINRQLGYVCFIALLGTAVFNIPLQSHLYAYIGLEAVKGFSAGGIDVDVTSIILEMWEEKSNPFMQGMYFACAIAHSLSPLILTPFLSPDHRQLDSDDSTQTSNSTLTKTQESRIWIPFFLMASILWMAAFLFILLFFLRPYRQPNRESREVKTTADQVNLVGVRESQLGYWTIVLLGCVLICCYATVQILFLQFFAKFGISTALNLSKATATLMTSVCAASYAVCCGLSIIVATRISVRSMLSVTMPLVLIGNILLASFANTSELMVWISLIVIGVGFSSTIPAIYSYLEQKINVTDFVCGLFLFSSSISSIAATTIFGHFIESYPFIFVYFNIIGLSVSCLILFFLLAKDK